MIEGGRNYWMPADPLIDVRLCVLPALALLDRGRRRRA